jgi:hypothetical protein
MEIYFWKISSYLTGQVAAITFSVQSECILNWNAHILYKHFLGKLWEKVKKYLSLVFQYNKFGFEIVQYRYFTTPSWYRILSSFLPALYPPLEN